LEQFHEAIEEVMKHRGCYNN